MIRSMTGHGTATVRTESSAVTVDLRTVNHRFFETRVKLPFEDPSLAHEMDQELRAALKRGRVECVVRLEGASVGSADIDEARVRTLHQAWQRLANDLSPGAEVPLAVIATAPNVYVSASSETSRDALRAAVLDAARDACRALTTMRVTEGEALFGDLTKRLALLEAHVAAIATLAENAPALTLERTRARVVELLGAHQTLDSQRLASELALLADKSDISEEITRFRSHVAQFRAALSASGEDGVGKRLDFLLQELSRETNTMGSKSLSSEVTHLVVETKAELERIREQVQNVA